MDFDWPACYSAMYLPYPLQDSRNMHSCSLLSHWTHITAWSGGIGNPDIYFLTLLMIFLDILIQSLAITACSTGFEVWIIKVLECYTLKRPKKKGACIVFKK